MLSKATPLLLTASPKITLHWSDGLLCIHFPYSLYTIQLNHIATIIIRLVMDSNSEVDNIYIYISILRNLISCLAETI